jgi:prevent-host-death family protein
MMALMQSTWGVAEARAQLGKVLEAARAGRDQVITSRGGTPVRVTSSDTPTPRKEHLHYLVVALAERDAGAVVLATRDGGRAISEVRFVNEASSDLLVWVFDEFGPEWFADYVRAMLLSIRALQKTFGQTDFATLSDVIDGLRRSTYNSRVAAIVASSAFERAVHLSVLPAFPEQERRTVLGRR